MAEPGRRVALVTGAGRGIGRAIAVALAADGLDVAVNFRRDRDAALDAVAAMRAVGVDADAFQASVGVDDECDRLAEQVLERFGRVDVVVHNAGNASRGSSVADTPTDEVRAVMAVHAVGPHRLTGALLPQMRRLGRGHVVFVSSTATISWRAGSGPYNMAKAAMEALAFTLAKEELGAGIRVNVVAPGLVATEMGTRLVRSTEGVDDIVELDDRMPFGRVCRPEDVAGVTRWLVSDEASYITGEKINVHAGGGIFAT